MPCEGTDIRGPVFITKYKGRQCCGCIPGFFPTDEEPRTTEIRNLRDLSICVNAPLERMPIPESSCEQAIVIKAYGNQTTINIQWTMIEEQCNIVLQTLDACCPETCSGKGGIDGGCTKTISNQLKWWGNVFQSSSIQDRYHFYIGDCFAMCCMCPAFDNSLGGTCNTCGTPKGAYPPLTCGNEAANQAFSQAYHKDGALQNFRAQQTGDSPIIYNAQITFYVGRPQGTPNEEFIA